ncbi:glycosyltransferase family 39 protein [Candidatus Woesearchaeota archaeon]|nr:glycosyltransferase family 39 protein [Candidatus Woesearchaeota archaeon]
MDKWSKLIIALIVVISLVRFINLESSVGSYWQGQLNSYVGLQIANGEIPYKDFILVYPPVGHYFMALFMFVFGKSLFSAFVLSNILAILSVVLVYLIAKKFFDQFQALLCTLLFSLMPIFSENGLFLEYFSVFFLLIGLYLFFMENNLGLFFSGVFFALSYFSKQTVGILMVGVLVYFLIKRKFKAIGIFLSGQILLSALLFAYLFKVTGGYEFLNQIFYQVYSPLARPNYFASVFYVLNFLMHPLYLLGFSGWFYGVFNFKERNNLEKLSLFLVGIFFVFVFLRANLISDYLLIIVMPFVNILSLRFFNFKDNLWKYFLVLIIVYSFLVGPLSALGKEIAYFPEKHDEIVKTAEYIKLVTNSEDKILGDNNGVAFYSGREKAGRIYDSSRAYMYAKVKIISDEDKINVIKNEKPKIVYIYDSRYDFLEIMDFFNEMYDKINTIGGYRIYKLK